MASLGQAFVEAMFADFDRSLREMGTGDLSVGREVKRMAQAFYGRVRAYDDGLEQGDALLEQALTRNVFGTTDPPPGAAAALAGYTRREAARLGEQRGAMLLAGEVVFGPPPDRAAVLGAAV